MYFYLRYSEGLESCMNSCNCPDTYWPVCVTLQAEGESRDLQESELIQFNFFSPCHAGCSSELQLNTSDIKVWF